MSRKWWYGIIEILPLKKKYDPVFEKVLRDYTNHPYHKEESSVVCAISVKLPCDLAIQRFREHLLKREKNLHATDFELVLTRHFPLPEAVANRSDIIYISAKCFRWRYGRLKNLRQHVSLLGASHAALVAEAQLRSSTFPL